MVGSPRRHDFGRPLRRKKASFEVQNVVKGIGQPKEAFVFVLQFEPVERFVNIRPGGIGQALLIDGELLTREEASH
jgi:hypothetical protein